MPQLNDKERVDRMEEKEKEKLKTRVSKQIRSGVKCISVVLCVYAHSLKLYTDVCKIKLLQTPIPKSIIRQPTPLIPNFVHSTYYTSF